MFLFSSLVQRISQSFRSPTVLRKECPVRTSYRHTAGTCCTGHSAQGKRLRCHDVTVIYQIAFVALRAELEETEIDQENVESFPVSELIERLLVIISKGL